MPWHCKVLPCRKLATFPINRFWFANCLRSNNWVHHLTSSSYAFLLFSAHTIWVVSLLAAHPFFSQEAPLSINYLQFSAVGHLWLWLQSWWLLAVFVNPWLLMIKPLKPYGFKINFSIRERSSIIAWLDSLGIKKRLITAHFSDTGDTSICTLLWS